MDRACSMHKGFGGKARRDHYEDLDVGGRIILI
jgi:hypothetical protein